MISWAWYDNRQIETERYQSQYQYMNLSDKDSC